MNTDETITIYDVAREAGVSMATVSRVVNGNKNVKEKHNKFVDFWNRIVEKGFAFTFKNKKLSLLVSLSILVVTLFSSKFLGTEFLPPLNEGALWVEAKLPMSSSLGETVKMVEVLKKEIFS